MRAESVVKRIVAEDAMHRKGSRPSSWTNTAVIAHLRSEVAELADELDLLKLTGKAPVALARAREELCDVYSVVLHLSDYRSKNSTRFRQRSCRRASRSATSNDKSRLSAALAVGSSYAASAKARSVLPVKTAALHFPTSTPGQYITRIRAASTLTF